jgi:hypothetical protein
MNLPKRDRDAGHGRFGNPPSRGIRELGPLASHNVEFLGHGSDRLTFKI